MDQFLNALGAEVMPFVFQALSVIVIAFVGLIARYAMKWLKELGITQQLQNNQDLVDFGIKAAQKRFDSGDWMKKKDYVVQMIAEAAASKGWKITEMEIDALIEGSIDRVKSEIKEDQLAKTESVAMINEIKADPTVVANKTAIDSQDKPKVSETNKQLENNHFELPNTMLFNNSTAGEPSAQ